MGYNITVAAPQDYVPPAEILEFNKNQSFKIITLVRRSLFILGPIARLWSVFKICLIYRPAVIISSGASAAFYSALPERLLCIKKVCIIHGPDFKIMFPGFITRFILARSVNIAVSKFSRRFVMDQHGLNSVHVINNGATLPGNIDKSIYNQKKSLYKGNKLLLTVGSMYPRKGQQIVIQALPEIIKYHKDIKYLIIGNERQKQDLYRLAQSLDLLPFIDFIGQVPKEHLTVYYTLCDIYMLVSQVLPNGDFEGFGISIIEAALMGTPAIGTRNTGIEDAIEDGETGLLVDTKSPEQTAAAVIELLDNEAKLNEMGIKARNRAQAAFTWEHSAKKLAGILKTEAHIPGLNI